MSVYIATFESKDKNLFEFHSECCSSEEAVKNGFKRIKDLGYSHFDYKLYSVIKGVNLA